MSRSRVELLLARRLAWKQPGRKRVSPAVGVAVAGVALSVLVMLISVSVMAGFKHTVRQKIMGMDAAITITAYDSNGEPTHFDPGEVLQAINLPADAAVEGRTEVAGILKTDTDFMGVTLRGNRLIPADSLASIAISGSIAAKLGLRPGHRIPTYFFIDNKLRVRSLRVDSIYSTGIPEHDDMIAYCSPALPGQLLALPEQNVMALGIKLSEPDRVKPLAGAIHSEMLHAYYTEGLSHPYGITDIHQTDSTYFTWLNLLDTNVVVIFTIMALVAAMTLISSLFIIILERIKTIGLLKALGADNGLIRRMVMLMAERLVLTGLLFGNILAITLLLLQKQFHIVPLDPAAYYVDHVPVEPSLIAFIAINAGVILFSWLVLMLPAMAVAHISPATTMRYN